MVAVPPILSSTNTVPECPDCLVAVRGERLVANVTCKAFDAKRVNITVGGKNVNVHTLTPAVNIFTSVDFGSNYTVTEEDHMVNVTCRVGYNHNGSDDVIETTNKLYVAGTSF